MLPFTFFKYSQQKAKQNRFENFFEKFGANGINFGNNNEAKCFSKESKSYFISL